MKRQMHSVLVYKTKPYQNYSRNIYNLFKEFEHYSDLVCSASTQIHNAPNWSSLTLFDPLCSDLIFDVNDLQFSIQLYLLNKKKN